MNAPFVAVQPKRYLLTKTVIVNLLGGFVIILTEFQGILPDFADILALPEAATRWIALALVVANLILRRLTMQPAVLRGAEHRSVTVPAA